MRSKKQAQNQLNFLAPTLKEQLNPNHELYLLADEIDWDYFEEEFKDLYAETGRPAHSIRLMVSLLILKSIYNLSDEVLVEQHWEMNSYFQYFSGEQLQRWGQPCAASELPHFRRRIGEAGAEKILKYSIHKHGKDSEERDASVDSTAQEKNTAYPTDAKLHKKIIDKCVGKAKRQHIKLRRSYQRTSKQLLRDTYNGTHPKRRKKANAAKRKPKAIAGRLARELDANPLKAAFPRNWDFSKKCLPNRKTARIRSTAFTDQGPIARARRTRNMDMAVKPRWHRPKIPGPS